MIGGFAVGEAFCVALLASFAAAHLFERGYFR